MNPLFRISALLALLLAPLLAAAPSERLNVLFIVADDLRNTLGCYGDAAAKSPNLDRLAARGVRFERAYAQYPVCNPSRTSFMTGLRAEQTGVVGNATLFRSLLPNVVTWPQLLRQSGWHATSYGKIYHAGGGGADGRDAWMDTGKSWDEAAMFQATPAGRVIEGRNLTGGKLKWCEWGMTGGTDDDQPDGQTAAHSVAMIEKLAASGQPWVVAAGFHRPHDPFLVPKKYFDLYPPGSLQVHHDPAGISPLARLSLPGGDFAAAFGAFTDVERMEFLRAYYAGVSFTDAQVGRLLATLDRLKLWERTLVIFISDHGYHHNERNWWNKNTLFDRSCRVPCLIVAPGVKGGAVCRSLVELVDLYPTIADYSGVKAPHALAGRSLRPLLENPTAPAPERDAAFTLVSRGPAGFGQALRTDRWRYIQWSDGDTELYDHTVDPEEEHNVANQPAHASLIRDFRARLQTTVPYHPSDSPSEGPAPARKKKKKSD